MGDEQRQHLELTRSIAERFNNKYGQTFAIPEALISKETGRIMSLSNPEQKMSKSEADPKGTIGILDDPKEIRRKIKEAVTDSGKEIEYNPIKKPAISNLLAIYHGFSGKSFEELMATYGGKKYAEFKNDLAEVVVEGLSPIQKKYSVLMKDKANLKKILAGGAKKAKTIANETLLEAKKKMGLF